MTDVAPRTRSQTSTGTRSRRIVIVAFDGVQALDLVGPFEVFTGAADLVASRAAEADPTNQGHANRAYEVCAVSNAGVTVTTESGLTIGTDPLPNSSTPIDTLVLTGGQGVQRARHDQGLIEWIRATAPRARRVATVCTGTFLA
ncbi:MAG: hypothetical protein RLZZ623_1602, partial [Actinomycetota bacterium]